MLYRKKTICACLQKTLLQMYAFTELPKIEYKSVLFSCYTDTEHTPFTRFFLLLEQAVNKAMIDISINLW